MVKYLTTKELSGALKVDPTTLWRWRKEGMPFLKLNNSIRFEEEKVISWLKEKGASE